MLSDFPIAALAALILASRAAEFKGALLSSGGMVAFFIALPILQEVKIVQVSSTLNKMRIDFFI
jgi:hypothetical protein